MHIRYARASYVRGSTVASSPSFVRPSSTLSTWSPAVAAAAKGCEPWRRFTGSGIGNQKARQLVELTGQFLVAGERSHCRYANLSSYFVIPNLTPVAA